MIQFIGDRIFNVGQRKDFPAEKVAYQKKAEGWVLVYKGDFEGLRGFLKNQQALETKRENRQMISDICGTSYRAAMEDMGYAR